MSTEHNRIRLLIESIKLNWNQSNWLVESIELLIELIDRGRSKSIKVGKRCKSSIEFDRPIDHFDWLRLIRPITSNRSNSIETNRTDRSNQSKSIKTSQPKKTCKYSIDFDRPIDQFDWVRSIPPISSIGFDWVRSARQLRFWIDIPWIDKWSMDCLSIPIGDQARINNQDFLDQDYWSISYQSFIDLLSIHSNWSIIAINWWLMTNRSVIDQNTDR